MQLLATYTRSIMNEATSRLNPSDAELERRIANEDRPNRFVLSGVYALPFGEGQRYGSGAPAWVRAVVGGWSVSGIYTYQSGAVLTWGNVIYLGGDLQWDPRNVDRAFNTAAFNTIPAQQLDRNIRTLPSDFGELRLDAGQHAERGAGEEHVDRQGLRSSCAPRRSTPSIACSSSRR